MIGALPRFINAPGVCKIYLMFPGVVWFLCPHARRMHGVVAVKDNIYKKS